MVLLAFDDIVCGGRRREKEAAPTEVNHWFVRSASLLRTHDDLTDRERYVPAHLQTPLHNKPLLGAWRVSIASRIQDFMSSAP
jgi:hypothetical protein